MSEQSKTEQKKKSNPLILVIGLFFVVLGLAIVIFRGQQYSTNRIYSDLFFSMHPLAGYLAGTLYNPLLIVPIGIALIYFSLPFTQLIKILITFAIIIIVGAVIMPSFLRFSGPPKAHEAIRTLIYLSYNEHKYHSKNGIYTSSFKELEWMPENIKNYCYLLSETEVRRPLTYSDCSLPPGIKPIIEKDKFLIVAVGNIDGDSTLDVWSIDENKELKNLVDDVKL